MKKKIINAIGCAITKWILHNCDDGLVVRRKGGAEQIIKVFSLPAYRNVIKPAICEKHNNWIPCRKQLPPNRKNVLVCWGGGNRSVGYYVYGGAGGWFFEKLAGGYKIPYDPYAWQPLPEEYKEVENEQ